MHAGKLFEGISDARKDVMVDKRVWCGVCEASCGLVATVENGRITAVGKHQELLKDCVVYQRLHDAQFQRLVA